MAIENELTNQTEKEWNGQIYDTDYWIDETTTHLYIDNQLVVQVINPYETSYLDTFDEVHDLFVPQLCHAHDKEEAYSTRITNFS